ncbi:MAG: hypothetical protein ABI422_03160 [Sphingomicrobium sp.]
MRKYLAVALAVSAFCAPVITPSTANAKPPPPSSQANPAVAGCETNVLPYVPQANLGECVAYSIIPNHALSTHDCDAFLEIDPAGFYAVFDSYSDCVRELRNTY